MNTKNNKTFYPSVTQTYETGKATYMSKSTLIKIRALEVAEKHVKNFLETKQQTLLKTVEKLEMIEDIIEKLPPYNWQQANAWTKRLLKLWREYGHSVCADPEPKSKSNDKAKPEEPSSMKKLRTLHFLEDSIKKIIFQKSNNSVFLGNVEGYLCRMEELISMLPNCCLPQEWTKKVEKLRSEYQFIKKDKVKEKKEIEMADSFIRLYLDDVFSDELLEVKVQPGAFTTIGQIIKMVSELLDFEKTPLTKLTLGYKGNMLDEQKTLAFYGIKGESVLDFFEFEDEEWTKTGQKSHSDIEDEIEEFFIEASNGCKFPVEVELMPKIESTNIVARWAPVKVSTTQPLK